MTSEHFVDAAIDQATGALTFLSEHYIVHVTPRDGNIRNGTELVVLKPKFSGLQSVEQHEHFLISKADADKFVSLGERLQEIRRDLNWMGRTLDLRKRVS
jgi:hypothetical protein